MLVSSVKLLNECKEFSEQVLRLPLLPHTQAQRSLNPYNSLAVFLIITVWFRMWSLDHHYDGE